MSEKDWVIHEVAIQKTGVFDLNGIMKTIRSWINLNNFDFHETENESDSKIHTIKWEIEKKMDDYTKYVIGFTFKISDQKKVKVKNKQLYEGKLSIKFNSRKITDYQEKWEGKPLKKFFRGIYDMFIQGDKTQRQSKDLKELTYDIYNQTKAFLNLQKFN